MTLGHCGNTWVIEMTFPEARRFFERMPDDTETTIKTKSVRKAQAWFANLKKLFREGCHAR
jgi:hypothetical protein